MQHAGRAVAHLSLSDPLWKRAALIYGNGENVKSRLLTSEDVNVTVFSALCAFNLPKVTKPVSGILWIPETPWKETKGSLSGTVSGHAGQKQVSFRHWTRKAVQNRSRKLSLSGHQAGRLLHGKWQDSSRLWQSFERKSAQKRSAWTRNRSKTRM